MITASINRDRIDRTGLVPGKNGTYLSIVLFENRNGPDQFGNTGFIVQDLPKERRDKGEKGPIIGNWKRIERKPDGSRQANQNGAPPPAPAFDEEDPDDIPF
jgi:hypothetical protein